MLLLFFVVVVAVTAPIVIIDVSQAFNSFVVVAGWVEKQQQQ